MTSIYRFLNKNLEMTILQVLSYLLKFCLQGAYNYWFYIFFFLFDYASWHMGSYFPDQGSNLRSLQWKPGVLTTDPPELVKWKPWLSENIDFHLYLIPYITPNLETSCLLGHLLPGDFQFLQSSLYSWLPPGLFDMDVYHTGSQTCNLPPVSGGC